VLLRFLPRKPLQSDPSYQIPVSVIIAAHNEERNLPAKLESLYTVDYPPALLEIVVASDGSTDRTNELLRAQGTRVRPVFLATAGGKANALNHAVAAALGQVLVFMDARQSVDPEAISQLVACFADPAVGAVSGELHLETPDGRPSPDALGVYWKIEKLVRKLESATGSVVGVTGAIFAMRREFYVPLPAGTLLDDVLTPMNVIRAGKRVLFLDSAIARDRIFSEPGKEFRRKVRTLTGNYQLLQLAPWLLSPRNPLLFRLISHKLLRLVVPLLLLVLLATSLTLTAPVYRLASLLQLLLYALALTGVVAPNSRQWRPISIAYTFVMLNVAAAVAFYNFVAGRARWA
jgi:poly-beta-1,6-N-acetyl-D-glucosamine synthase